MNVTLKKSEIINWIATVEDSQIISQIDAIKNSNSGFDFKKEIKGAISSDELKKRTTVFIKSLEWRK